MRNLPPTRKDPLGLLKDTISRWGAHSRNRQVFKLRQITILETLNLIQSLGNNTCYGHDGINALSIKIAAAVLSNFLMKWKIAKIIPLWKGKGLSKSCTKNYRPISMLPIIAKLTEKTVQKQLLEFLMNTKQLNMNHHTYQGSHSTTTTLIQISDAIISATDKNQISVLTTIDETAAFDTVNYKILDRKLQLYNCGDEFRT